MTSKSDRPEYDVTVVVTAYNHQAYVEQCLESIADQTVRPCQVVVIDDASRDQTADVVERWLADNQPHWTYLRHPTNAGVCASLNEALSMATGSSFCHVSGDDWEEPDRLERQVGMIERATDDVAILVGDIREVDPGGATIVEHYLGPRLEGVVGAGARQGARSRLLAENTIPAPGVLLRTAALREAGGYDESLVFEDYDAWLKIATDHAIGYMPGIVANYRVLATSMWRDRSRRIVMVTDEARILSKHVGRSATDDAIITRRLVSIASELLQLRAVSELRAVLMMASESSPDPWLKSAADTLRSPRALEKVRRMFHEELGVSASPNDGSDVSPS